MANFPRPHVPTGFSICEVPREEHPLRPRAFLGLSFERAFKNVAITMFFPWVAKEHFKLIPALGTQCGFPRNQALPFGEAFVSFNSPHERRRFVDGPTLEFDGYSISFEKHDEGENAGEYEMDREVWLLLVGYLLDARTTSTIAKAVSSFAMLRHVHESDVLSRIVIKACMNSETQVPPSIVVGWGMGHVFAPRQSPSLCFLCLVLLLSVTRMDTHLSTLCILFPL
jgi:hypothetical protein